VNSLPEGQVGTDAVDDAGVAAREPKLLDEPVHVAVCAAGVAEAVEDADAPNSYRHADINPHAGADGPSHAAGGARPCANSGIRAHTDGHAYGGNAHTRADHSADRSPGGGVHSHDQSGINDEADADEQGYRYTYAAGGPANRLLLEQPGDPATAVVL